MSALSMCRAVKEAKGKHMRRVIRASDIPDPDTSYLLPWTLDMLCQVEPELKEVAAAAVSQKWRRFYNRQRAYATAKRRAYQLVGWGARDPRLRSAAAWDCFFRYILDQLKI